MSVLSYIVKWTLKWDQVKYYEMGKLPCVIRVGFDIVTRVFNKREAGVQSKSEENM